MRHHHVIALALAFLSSVSCGHEPRHAETLSPSSGHLEIARAGSHPATKGAPEAFKGSVLITPLFSAIERTRPSGASVTFEPGARTAWHTHPAGQTLVVTAGTGWVQTWGGKKQEIKPGDVVWTPPGVKHWHGATTSEGMTHIAVQEPVGDEQYRH